MSKISFIAAITAICFLLILCLQIYWLTQSRDLIEDQFNQKVSMALCTAVSSFDACTAEECAMKNEQCVASYENGLSFSAGCLLDGNINEEAINEAIEKALLFYDLPREFDIQFRKGCDSDLDASSPYCCKLGAYNADTDHYIILRFPERQSYVLGKMWVMLLSSLAILALILMVFILSIRALIAQRKISEFNIDFFNNMAHEFRTPLANIKLALGRFGNKLRPDVLPYLDIIEGESTKLNENVERVLSLAKIEDGQYELNKEKIDLLDLLHAVLQDLGHEISDSNAKIIIDPGVQGVSVWADPLHMRHAFKNLIDNSIKYCVRRPVIEINIKRINNGIMLVFEDNGVGIDADSKKIVFDRFKRLKRKDHVKGFGLGLSYVKMIMDLHRGRINLFSQLGQGSRFELFFPKS